MFGIKTQLDMDSIKLCRQEFEKHLKNMQDLANKNVIKIKMDNINSQLNKTRNSFEGINSQTRSFADNMGYAIKRVSQFALGVSIVYGAVRELKSGLQEISNLNRSNTNIAMITGDSVENIQKMNSSWLEMSKNLKVVISETMSAEEEFLRAGDSIDEANKNVETNIKLARVANQNNKEVADSLIILKNAYNLNSEGVEKYANKVALLDTKSATSSAKINDAMSYTAQTAKEAGVSMDFLLGTLTTNLERSKQGGEAIGRAWKSIFLNMKKLQDGEDIEGLSKLEDCLNKQGIALRKNEKEWRSSELVIKDLQKSWSKFDDITKSNIINLMAGKNQAEQFQIAMNESTRVLELENKVKQDSNSLNEAYEKHLDSIDAKMANLKNTATGFWMKLIDSNTIKSGIDGITSIIKSIDYLITDNKLLGASILALGGSLLIATKHMAGFKFSIGEVITFLSLLKTEGIAAFGALMINPIILGFAAVVGIATYKIIEHIKHQTQLKDQTDQLKTSYDSLNKSIKDNDVNGMESSTSDLKKKQDQYKELLKQRKELEDRSKDIGKSDINDMEKSIAQNIISKQLSDVNKKIEEQAEIWEEAGFAINKTTGEIQELNQAENNLKNNEIVSSIKEKVQAELDNRNEIIKLIEEYQLLNEVENKSAGQRQRISQLSQELNNKIGGLILVTDEYGNVTIKNTGLLQTEVNMLNTENVTVQQLTNAKLQNARDAYIAEKSKTYTTYAEVKKRIGMYEKEMQSLNAYRANNNDDAVTVNGYQRYVAGLGNEIASLSGLLAEVDSIFSSGGGTPPPSASKIPSDGYIPHYGENIKGSNSSSSKSNNNEVDNLELEIDRYKKLNTAIQDVENQVESLNTLEEGASGDYKVSLLDKELKLLNQKKELYKQLHAEQLKERIELKTTLSSQGVAFGSRGEIKNYDALLKSKQNWANNLSGKSKEKAIDTVKNLEDEMNRYLELTFDAYVKSEQMVNDVNNQITDIMNEKFTTTIDGYKKNIDDLNNKLENIDDNMVDSQQQKLKLNEELLQQQEEMNKKVSDQLKMVEQIITKQSDGATKQKWTGIYDQLKADSEEIKNNTQQIIRNLESTITDMQSSIEDLQSNIVNALKAQYEAQQKLQIDPISDEIKELQERLKELQDQTPTKEKQLENLKMELSQWQKDDSIFSKSKQAELTKQIEDLTKELQISDLEKEIEDKQNEVSKIQEGFSNALQEDKLLNEALEIMKRGDATEINDLLTSWLPDYQNKFALFGDDYKKTFITQTQKQLSEFENFSSIAKEIRDKIQKLNNQPIVPPIDQETHTAWVTGYGTADDDIAQAYKKLGWKVKVINDTTKSMVEAGDVLVGLAGTLYGNSTSGTAMTGSTREETRKLVNEHVNDLLEMLEDLMGEAIVELPPASGAGGGGSSNSSAIGGGILDLWDKINGGSSSSSSSSGSSGGGTIGKISSNNKDDYNVNDDGSIGKVEDGWVTYEYKGSTSSAKVGSIYDPNSDNFIGYGYANGTTSAIGGLSMVGEEGAELRVLNKGDGIIPTNITKNLMELGKNPSKYLNHVIANIQLPNIALPDFSKLMPQQKQISANQPLIKNEINMYNNTPFDVQNNFDNLERKLKNDLQIAGVNLGLIR